MTNPTGNDLFQFADAFDTLADVALINDRNLSDVEGIRDLLDDAPVLRMLAAGTASNGNVHKYEKEITAPVVGFRDANSGIEHSKSGDEIVTVNLKFLDPHTRVDSAVAKTYTKRPGGVEGYIARKNARHLRAAFAQAEKQIFNGTGNDSDGFAGLKDNAAYSSLGEVCIDGGGTGSGLSSVWAIRTNDSEMDCTVILGEDGQITIGETVLQEVEDSTGKHYMAYVTDMGAWIGLQIGSKYSVVRLANVASLTDAKLSELVEACPFEPTFLAMNRSDRGELQRSRTATTTTGAFAQMPVDHDGIPIVKSEHLVNNETAVTA